MGESRRHTDEAHEALDTMTQVVADAGGDPERPRTRRQLLMLGGAVAGGAVLGMTGTAHATDGSAVLAGVDNTATATTSVTSSGGQSSGISIASFAAFNTGTGGIGLRGSGNGVGTDLKLDGTGRLSQSSAAGATGGAQPTTSYSNDLARGDANELWATAASGWKRINAVRTDHPNGTGAAFAPFRFLDTRSGAALNTNTTYPYDVVGNANIPDDAVAIFGNLTCIPNYQGFVTLFPKGVTAPLVANVNFNPGTIAGNFFFVGLGTGANAGQLSVRPGDAPSKSTHVIIDIFAYVQ